MVKRMRLTVYTREIKDHQDNHFQYLDLLKCQYYEQNYKQQQLQKLNTNHKVYVLSYLHFYSGYKVSLLLKVQLKDMNYPDNTKHNFIVIITKLVSLPLQTWRQKLIIMCNFMNQLIEDDLNFHSLVKFLAREGWWQ
jgi:hypothetical protein